MLSSTLLLVTQSGLSVGLPHNDLQAAKRLKRLPCELVTLRWEPIQ